MKDQTRVLLAQQARQFHCTFMELTGRRSTVRKSLLDVFRTLKTVLRALRTLRETMRQADEVLDQVAKVMLAEDDLLRVWGDRTEGELTSVLHSWRN